jgi:hypothetical protein
MALLESTATDEFATPLKVAPLENRSSAGPGIALLQAE